jgi:CO/xanthine dehydrogenase FAD-binding subunit
MKPPPFSYERASDVDGALDFLARHGGDGKVLAGGQSLAPLLNLRLARPTALVDINPILGLGEIRQQNGSVQLGALVRQAVLERSSLLATKVPLVVEAVRHVGHAQIRNRGTVGGSVAHADPAAELPACLLALEAVFLARSFDGERSVPADAFFRGPLTTALSDDELLTEIEFPLPSLGTGQAFVELARRHGDFAIAGVAALITLADGGICTRATVALLAAAEVPLRARGAEALLVGERIDEARVREAAEEAGREARPASDVHGSSEFRRRISRDLVFRAVLTANERAQASVL